MSTQHTDLHAWLSSKLANFISWISAALGVGTFLGYVNIVVGVLSACWLGVSLWNYFTHTRPKNKLEMELLRQKLAAHRAKCEMDDHV